MAAPASRRRLAWRLALGALCLAAWGASGNSFYKWTDKDGNVHYGDKPAKGALGVTRIEIDPAPIVQAPALPPANQDTEASRKEASVPDLATERRTTREALDARLHQAREKLDLARAALAEASSPGDDERDVVQQRREVGTSGRPDSPASENTGGALGTGGMLGMAPRSNCRQAVGKDGKKMVICPTMVPNQKYAERMAGLEDAVKRAEEEVADAERAYRRGVD